ncbi:hypothetical protein AB4262_10720 [Vibrio breoganii]
MNTSEYIKSVAEQRTAITDSIKEHQQAITSLESQLSATRSYSTESELVSTLLASIPMPTLSDFAESTQDLVNQICGAPQHGRIGLYFKAVQHNVEAHKAMIALLCERGMARHIWMTDTHITALQQECVSIVHGAELAAEVATQLNALKGFK